MLDLKPTARARRAWVCAVVSTALTASIAGCSTPMPTTDGGNNADGADSAPPPPPPFVHMSVDSNRDGVVQMTDADRAHRAEWSTTFGASFLANLDDDDTDGAIDANDMTVNGEGDEADLARINIEPSMTMP